MLKTAGDWLQGPYIYAVYKSYGFELSQIAILFVTGFLSSGIFGTIIGSAADKFGRKKFCLLFTLLYSSACFIILSSNFYILLIGRILGGISTSLLFSVFEAWMVNEHFSRGFSSLSLSDTFSKATFGNGLVAIFSGLLANWLVEHHGVSSPFLAAIGFFATAAMVIILTWKENYGNTSENVNTFQSLFQALNVIMKDSHVLAIGAVQSLYEASMYIFVFLWGPFLESQHDILNNSGLPFGMIFASFMVAIMIGSLFYGHLSGPMNIPLSNIASGTFLVASISLLLPLFIENEFILFILFIVFELTCGLYFPLIGTFRAKVISEDIRATVGNLFRVPLNLIVVYVLISDISIPEQCLFCGFLLFVAFIWSFWLPMESSSKKSAKIVAKIKKSLEKQRND
ncbi:17644_t:CDS:10 [Cetraspora pellucida]|uniref:Molybdate-anion transporter n=1 Tax=Cetraspora pellucida TaxID=1433469 RepID=A0A9N9GT66_9GLOM|nr:17644_t:CDS:10 [Cetraspora pellucida]